jgi:hypothetical protein
VTTPRLTAEAAIGPAIHTYAAAASQGTESLAPMGFLDGILEKVPCLLSCGVPHALTIALQCGMDEGCWMTKAPSAGLQCVKQCLA